MKQILHIFSKDVRRLWVEILLSVVVSALFAWGIPTSWINSPIDVVGHFRQGVFGAVLFLVPLSWCLLIARLIHGEVLVGDRQFWVTRPYEWPKLLAAKALFIALIIYLPFLLMQASILAQAGFNPLSYIPGLLYRCLLMSAVFFPLIGLAAVTSNLVRMALTLLAFYAVFVAYSVIVYLAVIQGWNNVFELVVYNPVSWRWLVAVVVILLVSGAAIVLQYARRRLLMARLLLGSTPFLALLAGCICNSRVWMNWTYPPAAQRQPPTIQMIAEFPFTQDVDRSMVITESMSGRGNDIDTRRWAVIKVFVRPSEVAAGDRWRLDAYRPTLTPVNGAPVKLDWQQVRAVDFEAPNVSDQPGSYLAEFLVQRADYERLRSSPVTLRIDFALTQARIVWSRRLVPPNGSFIIPGFASCSTIEDSPGGTTRIYDVACRFPLREPTQTIVTAVMTEGPCSASTGNRTKLGIGFFETAPATLGISPIEEMGLMTGSAYNGASFSALPSSYLCPGEPVVLTQYRKVRTVQTSATIEGFDLADH